MDDLFKKFINTGVGLVSQGNKAMQTAIEKLVKESKISEQEGKKIVDDLLKNSETKRHDLEKQFKTLTADLRTRVGLDAGTDEKKKPTPPAKAKAAAKPAAKTATAKKPATSTTAQAAGTVKKAAAKVSDAAAKTQRSAAAKAGAAKKAGAAASEDGVS